ncbi:glycosyltransferase [Candidatus Pelagibacter sp.]|nr:glycosyltransferase [Candidatus Pelagibacter sp.]
MTISRQNLTIIVVSFMSENVIHECIKSIPDEISILIVDNSGNKNFKKNIENTYKNVQCIISPENLGMGSGNNLGLKNIKTNFAFILNPDVIMEKGAIDEIINASKNLDSFGIIAPISNKKKYPNYKLIKKKSSFNYDIDPFKVKSVDGFAMILNLKKLNQLKSFENYNYFDENFFLYLENDDLCKRVIDNNENIYVVPQSKINHLGASAVNSKYKYQIELLRNWHWIWSKFYFNKKHYSFLFATLNGLPSFLSAVLKLLFYFIIDKKKKEIYFHRASGYLNALLGKKSFLRPKINN